MATEALATVGAHRWRRRRSPETPKPDADPPNIWVAQREAATTFETHVAIKVSSEVFRFKK